MQMQMRIIKYEKTKDIYKNRFDIAHAHDNLHNSCFRDKFICEKIRAKEYYIS